MENATLYTQVRPAGGEMTSVLVRDGRIQALGGPACRWWTGAAR
jgi:hypothetical protein